MINAKINSIKRQLLSAPGGMSDQMATAKACARIVADLHYVRNQYKACHPYMTLEFEEAATLMYNYKTKQFKEALNNILIECDACFDEQTTTTLESIIKHQISIL